VCVYSTCIRRPRPVTPIFHLPSLCALWSILCAIYHILNTFFTRVTCKLIMLAYKCKHGCCLRRNCISDTPLILLLHARVRLWVISFSILSHMVSHRYSDSSENQGVAWCGCKATDLSSGYTVFESQSGKTDSPDWGSSWVLEVRVHQGICRLGIFRWFIPVVFDVYK
jgi:hypothetical protein